MQNVSEKSRTQRSTGSIMSQRSVIPVLRSRDTALQQKIYIDVIWNFIAVDLETHGSSRLSRLTHNWHYLYGAFPGNVSLDVDSDDAVAWSLLSLTHTIQFNSQRQKKKHHEQLSSMNRTSQSDLLCAKITPSGEAQILEDVITLKPVTELVRLRAQRKYYLSQCNYPCGHQRLH